MYLFFNKNETDKPTCCYTKLLLTLSNSNFFDYLLYILLLAAAAAADLRCSYASALMEPIANISILYMMLIQLLSCLVLL